MKTEKRSCPATRAWRDFLASSDWGRDRFFAVFTPEIPHSPSNPPQQYRDLYKDVDGLVGFQKTHYPMTTWFDELVWEILRPLELRGLEDDTLVLFFADNGLNSEVYLDPFNPEKNRGKASLSSLGMRTPFVFRWPKGTKRTAGKRYDDLVDLSDIFETLARVTGSDPKLRRVPPTGKHILRRLRRGKQLSRKEVIAQVGDASLQTFGRIVTTPEWRYVQDIKHDREELYAIDIDPREEHDLAPEAGDDVLDTFRDMIDDWVEEAL